MQFLPTGGQTALAMHKIASSLVIPITLVEPQMTDLHHSPFNAALLHAILLAYPDVSISFIGFQRHVDIVSSILKQNAVELWGRVTWTYYPDFTTRYTFTRWFKSSNLISTVLCTNDRLLFCSISRMQLLQVKRAMTPNQLVRVVLHGELDNLDQVEERHSFKSLVSFQKVLLRPNPIGLRYLLLGNSIRDCIPPRYRAALANSGVIDHPYHFANLATSSTPIGTNLIFGIFGNAGDGKKLAEVVQKVRELTPRVRFKLIGFVSDAEAAQRLQGLVEDVGFIPISHRVFFERSQGVTHTLWIAEPNSYRLRASGTFFDALAHCKPMVYTSNAFLDAYLVDKPGIAIKCDSLDQVPGAIESLLKDTTPDSYLRSQELIVAFRKRFTPLVLAGHLAQELLW
jgi:hypothetical protein